MKNILTIDLRFFVNKIENSRGKQYDMQENSHYSDT